MCNTIKRGTSVKTEYVVLGIVALLGIVSLAGFFQSQSIATGVVVQGQQITNTVILTGLELNEPIGKDIRALTAYHLLALGDGRVVTGKAATDYQQSLRFQRPGIDGFVGGAVEFVEDEYGNVGNFLGFKDVIFEYEVSFSPGLQSDIEDGRLPDFEDRYLKLMGKTFVIVDSQVSGNAVRLTMFGPTGSVEFFDDSFLDNQFTRGVRINAQSIEAFVRIKALRSGGSLSIASIEYRLLADPRVGTDVYVPSRYGVRDFLRYPQGMLVNEFDILYGGMVGGPGVGAIPQRVSSNIVQFQPARTGYNLRFTNQRGQLYSIPLIDANGILTFGKDDRELVFRETGGFFIDRGDYLIVTNKNDVTGITNVLRYDQIDLGQGLIYFEDLAGGQHTGFFDKSTGDGNVGVGGYNYRFTVSLSAPHPLAVDLNMDGTIGSGTANIVILGGGILELGSPGSSTTVKLRTKRRLFDEPTTDEVTTILIFKSNGRLDLDISGLETFRDREGIDKGLTRFGALFLLESRYRPSRLTIEYPTGGRVGRTVGQAQGFVAITFERERLIKK